jgi:16S rRNA (guanine527-N7)-methyltransferase
MTGGCAGALPLLLAGARQLRVPLGDEQQDRFIRYCSLLEEWNAHTNLSAIRTPEGVMRTLFLDSLSLAPTIVSICDEPARSRVVDIGTGAGLPSLPLNIVFPEWSLALVESVGKKTRFLSAAAGALQLNSVAVYNRRAEDMTREREFRDVYDLALARAVSALPVLVELCGPFVRVGGHLVFPKSGALEEEVEVAGEAGRRLGLRLLRVDPVDPELGLGEGRKIVVYVKERPTPSGYPRRTGLAQSRPLGVHRA